MKRGGHEATIPRWSDKSLRIDAQPTHQTHRTSVSPAVDLITKRCAQRVRCETKNTFSTRYAANTLTEYTRSRINRMGNEQKVRIHSYTLHFIVAFVNGFGFIQAKSRYTTQSTVCVHIIYHIVFSHIQSSKFTPTTFNWPSLSRIRMISNLHDWKWVRANARWSAYGADKLTANKQWNEWTCQNWKKRKPRKREKRKKLDDNQKVICCVLSISWRCYWCFQNGMWIFTK